MTIFTTASTQGLVIRCYTIFSENRVHHHGAFSSISSVGTTESACALPGVFLFFFMFRLDHVSRVCTRATTTVCAHPSTTRPFRRIHTFFVGFLPLWPLCRSRFRNLVLHDAGTLGLKQNGYACSSSSISYSSPTKVWGKLYINFISTSTPPLVGRAKRCLLYTSPSPRD